jgi:butyryl-CoA dehydrogenase
MVRDFAREEILPTAAERDRTKEFPLGILRKMGELGLMGMNVPPEYNGAGVDTVSYSVALQEVAYACASSAVIMSVHNSVACGPILLFGSDHLKETYLKPLAAGKKIGSFALTEPGAGSDPASQKCKAVKDGSTYILNGTKIFITTGKNSDLTVVTSYTTREKRHRGISAFIVEKGTPGFTVGKEEEKMGLRSSDTVELIFEDCRVPETNLLGREGDGFIIAMASLDGLSGCGDQLCKGKDPVRKAHRPVPRHPLDDRRHGDSGGSISPPHLSGGSHEGPGRDFYGRSLHGKGLCLGDG